MRRREALTTKIRFRSLLAVAGLLLGTAGAVAQGVDPRATEIDRLMAARRYKEAQQLSERYLAEARARRDETEIAPWGLSLARADVHMGRFDRAEGLFRQGIAFFQDKVGLVNAVTGTAIADLGLMYLEQDKLDEAEPLLQQGLNILERTEGPESANVGFALGTLAKIYSRRGRFAEAERLYKRALAVSRKALGPGHSNTLVLLGNLAALYEEQARAEESEAAYKELLGECRKYLRPDDPMVGEVFTDLGGIAMKRKRYEEAESLYRRALAVAETHYGPEHFLVAELCNKLGRALLQRGRKGDALPLFKKSLTLYEKSYGPDHPKLAETLMPLAVLEADGGRLREASDLCGRCVAILDRAGADPAQRFQCYIYRASLAFVAGRRDAAVFADVRKAMDLAELQRGRVSGGALERSAYFATFATAFELMVGLQDELGDKGDPAEAFAAMERFHARSLLDEMAMAGSDPDLGRPPGEREALKRQEDELHRRVAGLEARAAGEKDAARAGALAAELAQARERLYAHYRDAQESSPVYRDLLSRTAKLPTLDEVRRWLKPGDLLLEFLAGGTGGFLVAVTPSSARIWSMHLNDDEARVMGVEPGRLSADLMRRAFLNAQGTGLVQQLADPRAAVPVAKLRILWNTVVPDNFHKDLADGTIRRLIVIPDGPVGLFPFEALVTNDGPAPEYLLDTGPPVVYAPSAAVLLSLDARPVSGPAAGREPVLALGDPAYGGEGLAAGAIDPSRAAGSARSAYARSGGRLPRLPFSGIEAQWVVQQFRDNGVKAGLLTGTSATERGVRYWAPGRKVLHLACHGLADEARGNLFGALALTPGPGAAGDAADDGFLTLKEIYGLGLKGCELTVLSACQTNFGPEQLGEGTLALSRGFLVAGARRVVASNWLVDDEAAADLVSVYASHLARAEKGNQPADHAASLRDAKRWVRAQEKWKAPYYWAALVLIGPS